MRCDDCSDNNGNSSGGASNDDCSKEGVGLVVMVASWGWK